MAKVKDLSGLVFGKITVLRLAYVNQSAYWLCQCDCGTEWLVRGSSLTSGNTSSCGCSQFDNITKHGMSDTKVYRVWQDMIQRCHNPNDTGYHNWGGRGISVCDEWRKPEPFLEWADGKWAEGLELDRIDNEGNYSPDNCRFVTKAFNNMNRRARTSSGYAGISWMKERNKWRSRITIDGVERHLGLFDDLLDAVEARQNAMNEYQAMLQAAQEEVE